MKSTWDYWIDELGYISYPILSYVLKNNFIFKRDINIYLNCLFNFWNGNYEKLIEIEESTYEFSEAKYDILFSSILFEYYYYTKNWDKLKLLYSDLENMYSFVSPNLRIAILQMLLSYEFMTGEYKHIKHIDSVFKYSKNTDKGSFMAYKAKFEFRANNNPDNALLCLKDGLKYVNKIQRPFPKISLLNLISYYSYKCGKYDDGILYAEKLSYILGYFRDSNTMISDIPYLDTVICSLKDPRHLTFFANSAFKSNNKNYTVKAESILRRADDYEEVFDNYYNKVLKNKDKKYKIPLFYKLAFLDDCFNQDIMNDEKAFLVKNKNYILPYEKARIRLINIFFQNVDNDVIEKFEESYSNTDDSFKETLKNYIMTYSRLYLYRNYIEKLEVENPHKVFNKYHLCPKTAEISLYKFDDRKTRERIVTFFEGII